MSQLMEWLELGLSLTLSAAVAALPVALLVVAIDALAGRRMTAKYRCLLWTLVAARLLLPVAPASPLSVQNAWKLLAINDSPAVEVAIAIPAVEDLAFQAATTSPDPASLPINIAPAVPAASGQATFFEAATVIVTLIWLAGAVLLFLRAFVATVRFARRLRVARQIDDEAVVQLLVDVCRQMGVRRAPPIRSIPGLSAPAVFGAFRPTLCLPAEALNELSAGQLRMIMQHEVAHLRRFDGMQSWLLTAVQAIHWFNPIAWLITRRITLYRELACDDAVRQLSDANCRRTYADLLLRFAANRPIGGLGLLGMALAKPAGQLATRIEAFGQLDVRRPISRRLLVALVGCLAVASFTDAASPDAIESPEAPRSIAEWMANGDRGKPSSSAIAPFDPVDDTLEVRTYDISRALQELAEVDPRADARRWLMTYLTLPTMQPDSVELVDGDPNQLRLAMTVAGHKSWTDMLRAIERSGPWQVTVRTRILRAPKAESLGDVDWENAVRFAPPAAQRSPDWPTKLTGADAEDKLSLSVESVSWEYAPYLALVLDDKKMRRVADRFQHDPRLSLSNGLQVTVFGGQQANLRDESYRPFVVGVHYVKGELATAAQPDIAVVAEGTSLDVQPWVVDRGALDLQCRLTVSRVDRVSETKLPGQEITVQNPQVSRRTISVRCRVTPGETLLIAPLAASDARDAAGVTIYALTAEWFPDSVDLVGIEPSARSDDAKNAD